uniref:Uncharacterized protein n=1 Tax=Strongyloides venezuelensis TaxID=75913 RepID=A0A0K0FNC8_STRVS
MFKFDMYSMLLILISTKYVGGYGGYDIIKCPSNTVIQRKCSERIRTLFVKFLHTKQIEGILEILIEPAFNSTLTHSIVVRDAIAFLKNTIDNDQYQTGMLTYFHLCDVLGASETIELFRNTILVVTKTTAPFIRQLSEMSTKLLIKKRQHCFIKNVLYRMILEFFTRKRTKIIVRRIKKLFNPMVFIKNVRLFNLLINFDILNSYNN